MLACGINKFGIRENHIRYDEHNGKNVISPLFLQIIISKSLYLIMPKDKSKELSTKGDKNEQM